MNQKNVKILRGLFATLVLMIANAIDALAQCPMCRITLESNLKNGGTAGSGINAGIFMLLGMPYLIVGTIAYVWWKNRKKKEDFELEEQLEW
jgi:LPXTG-motif cell wall-anchored protein